MKLLINVVAFKTGWLASVVGSANGSPMIGPIVILAAVAIHLRMVSEPAREFSLILITGAIGFCADSILVSAGWVTYANGTFIAGFAPYWILAMWILFATTLNVAFRWLQERLLLATVLGAVSGPASYYAGAKIGAIVLIDPVSALVALSVGWAIILPALMVLAKQLDGTQMPILQSRV